MADKKHRQANAKEAALIKQFQKDKLKKSKKDELDLKKQELSKLETQRKLDSIKNPPAPTEEEITEIEKSKAELIKKQLEIETKIASINQSRGIISRDEWEKRATEYISSQKKDVQSDNDRMRKLLAVRELAMTPEVDDNGRELDISAGAAASAGIADNEIAQIASRISSRNAEEQYRLELEKFYADGSHPYWRNLRSVAKSKSKPKYGPYTEPENNNQKGSTAELKKKEHRDKEIQAAQDFVFNSLPKKGSKIVLTINGKRYEVPERNVKIALGQKHATQNAVNKASVDIAESLGISVRDVYNYFDNQIRTQLGQ